MNQESAQNATTLLKRPNPQDHIVRFYQDPHDLAGVVAQYLAEGIRADEAALAIATPERQQLIIAALAREGIDAGAAVQNGRLTFLNAAETLASCCQGDHIDGDAFDAMMEQQWLESTTAVPTGRLRAFGQMVDLLWQSGRLDTALRLEQCWEAFIARHTMTLLCAYQMDPFGDRDQTYAVEQVCATHTHALLYVSRDRLDAAVQQAADEVLGSGRIAALQPLIDAAIYPKSTLGPAERTIFWLRKNLPSRLEPVLARTKILFHAPTPTAVDEAGQVTA